MEPYGLAIYTVLCALADSKLRLECKRSYCKHKNTHTTVAVIAVIAIFPKGRGVAQGTPNAQGNTVAYPPTTHPKTFRHAATTLH